MPTKREHYLWKIGVDNKLISCSGLTKGDSAHTMSLLQKKRFCLHDSFFHKRDPNVMPGKPTYGCPRNGSKCDNPLKGYQCPRTLKGRANISSMDLEWKLTKTKTQTPRGVLQNHKSQNPLVALKCLNSKSTLYKIWRT